MSDTLGFASEELILRGDVQAVAEQQPISWGADVRGRWDGAVPLAALNSTLRARGLATVLVLRQRARVPWCERSPVPHAEVVGQLSALIHRNDGQRREEHLVEKYDVDGVEDHNLVADAVEHDLRRAGVSACGSSSNKLLSSSRHRCDAAERTKRGSTTATVAGRVLLVTCPGRGI
jgi:hypothetical protein